MDKKLNLEDIFLKCIKLSSWIGVIKGLKLIIAKMRSLYIPYKWCI